MDRTLNENLDREFRTALAEAIKDTPLQGRWLDTYGPGAQMAALLPPDANGGWWVACGLAQDPRRLPEHWQTFVNAVYRSEEETPYEGEYALDVHLAGTGARDGAVLAAMVVTAVMGALARNQS